MMHRVDDRNHNGVGVARLIGNRCDGLKDRLEVLSVAELLGEAIRRIHENASVSALFANEPGRALSE